MAREPRKEIQHSGSGCIEVWAFNHYGDERQRRVAVDPAAVLFVWQVEEKKYIGRLEPRYLVAEVCSLKLHGRKADSDYQKLEVTPEELWQYLPGFVKLPTDRRYWDDLVRQSILVNPANVEKIVTLSDGFGRIFFRGGNSLDLGCRTEEALRIIEDGRNLAALRGPEPDLASLADNLRPGTISFVTPWSPVRNTLDQQIYLSRSAHCSEWPLGTLELRVFAEGRGVHLFPDRGVEVKEQQMEIDPVELSGYVRVVSVQRLGGKSTR